jgi:lipoyl(octanoyl) transferase
MKPSPNKSVFFADLEQRDFKVVWDLQESLMQQIIEQKIYNRQQNTAVPTQNHLLFVEHNPVYTLGKSGNKNNLLKSIDELNELGISYYPINRGGDITFHGPGQLVGYPIFDLENFYTDIHRFLREIEEVIIQTIAHFGLEGYRVDGRTGVWVNDRKICAIGVRTSRWVSMHGFALNVNTDLSYFDHIIPCGIADKEVTSIERETGKKADFKLVKSLTKAAFASIFGINYLE